MQRFLLKAASRHTIPPSLCLISEESERVLAFAVELVRRDLCDEEGREGCTCSQCHLIGMESHPDMTLVEPTGKAGIITVEQVREIRRGAYQPPFQGRHKVFILNRSHRLNLAAANALLKVLEEPPEMTRFILLTSNATLLLPTIRSRCALFTLPFPPSPLDLPEEAIPILDEPFTPLLLIRTAALLSPFPLTESAWILSAIGDRRGEELWHHAALDLLHLLADTSATFQNRIILERSLLKAYRAK